MRCIFDYPDLCESELSKGLPQKSAKTSNFDFVLNVIWWVKRRSSGIFLECSAKKIQRILYFHLCQLQGVGGIQQRWVWGCALGRLDCCLIIFGAPPGDRATYTLQHTASHCSTLQRTATHCNTLQHIPTHCNTLCHRQEWSHLFSLTLSLTNTLSPPSPHLPTLTRIFRVTFKRKFPEDCPVIRQITFWTKPKLLVFADFWWTHMLTSDLHKLWEYFKTLN